ncbi:hypothetical protein V8C35DRAFT_288197 [Trichoderma chlorosporum]
MGGCTMKLKMSQHTGGFSVAGTPMGTLKWKAYQLTGGSTFTLCDSHGKNMEAGQDKDEQGRARRSRNLRC